MMPEEAEVLVGLVSKDTRLQDTVLIIRCLLKHGDISDTDVECFDQLLYR